jgi:hypothetical protein
MNEVLTMAEIESRFDAEWVLLDDVATDERNHVLSGRVLAHSRDRDELDRSLLALRPRHFAVFYNGNAPEGMEYALNL